MKMATRDSSRHSVISLKEKQIELEQELKSAVKKIGKLAERLSTGSANEYCF